MLMPGLVLGIVQGAVLRSALSHWRWAPWLGATVLSGTIIGPCVVVTLYAVLHVSGPGLGALLILGAAGAVGVATGGATLGFAQSFVVAKHFRGEGWWITVSALSSGLGAFIVAIVDITLLGTDQLSFVGNPSQMSFAWIVSWALYALIVGSITGWVLVKLPREG